MSCCPATAEPARGPADHSGHMKKTGNTNIYVTGPASATAGILAYPDIYGLDSGRIKSDADTLGKLGYAVVAIDLADGDYLESTDGIEPWFRKHTFAQLGPHIQDAVKYLKTEVGVERLASYGMCWGSWVGATQTVQTDPVVLGHVSFHPTWAIENMLKGNDTAVDTLAKSVKVPQLLLVAGDDPECLKPGGRVHDILKSRADIGPQSDVILFADEKHGWVHRGDLENAATKTAVMTAWHSAVKFIQTVCPL